jgi:3-deoxy-manno-octulosonate cytidylyltransferase (CMP-KDO synthetase)
MPPRTLIVIPARLGSTRLPRKVLLKETGRYLIDHVHERAKAAKRADRVLIATDSDEVARAARSFGAEAVLTREDHPSGTDRVAEAAADLVALGERPFDLVVNVQGDEPELDPGHIDTLVELMERSKTADMGTLAEPLDDPAELVRPQVVKVVCDAAGHALYFSRAPIPDRAGPPPAGEPRALRHVGIYAYRPAFLQAFCRLAPAPLEKAERLEQLRALWHGHRIVVGVVAAQGARGIDTPEDYARFVARVRG